jgi:hypothetical protein
MPYKILDFRPVGFHCNDPSKYVGRFTGAGSSVPTAVANVPGAGANVMTLSRSGTGTLSLVLLSTVGVVQNYDFWTESTSNAKTVQVTPPGTGFTFALQINWVANGAAVDLQANEELCFEISKSESSRP